MSLIRAFVFSAAVAVALAPLAALAADTSPTHTADELANGLAQWDLAQQQISQLQIDANRAAQNERMIALAEGGGYTKRPDWEKITAGMTELLGKHPHLKEACYWRMTAFWQLAVAASHQKDGCPGWYNAENAKTALAGEERFGP